MITANVSGRLAFDARTITTKSGKPMTTARMACNDDDGATIWIDLLAFNQNAEWLSRCVKSDRVAAIGTLKLNQWTDKRTGEKREVLQLVVDNMLANAPKPKKAKASYSAATDSGTTVSSNSPATADPFHGDEENLPW